MIEKFLIGTYTLQTSHGVYDLELDDNKKRLQNLRFVAGSGNPTYLAISKANRIYAIDKVWPKNLGEGNDHMRGGLQVLDNNSRPAIVTDTKLDPGVSPCYVTVDEKQQLVFTANYHTGAIIIYKIMPKGKLQETDRVVDKGHQGPRPEQKDGAHPHFADLTPDGRLVVVDLGQDRIYLYNLSDEGKLSPVSKFQFKPGFGPRHIVFDPKKGVAYVSAELSSNVAVMNYDAKVGKFSLKQVISTIPDTWTKHNGAAAIRMSKDGKFIYVSNRGFNSIAVFQSDAEGKLKLIQEISTEGDFPRDFNFNHDQSMVIALNQNTNNATLYERNASTGKLKMIQKDFKVPEGVCVCPEKIIK
ncbi:lactonase family protein [Acetilactobacillus jinshanensis]|uniref:Lactonase family protein n=1 Tax=Acetilactobacillus jinshanensis TaxID=1720083 RepID=A0A4P6ZJ63_9LACO|nr:lactonase family protein [Acetilactobacillus jinshanensis]QBP17765.1 lactonase family protein [Acetilactobacillus jinshanensis]URL60627.1 lactonase family protein [uncultured bacterium]